MHLQFERVKKITEELYNYIYSDQVPIDGVHYKEGKFPSINEVNQSPSPWLEFHPDARWGGRNIHRWFRATVTIPENFAGKTAAFRLVTGETPNSWDATNPQFILYIDGELIQGLDINHQEVIFTRRAEPGRTHQLDLDGYSGILKRLSEFHPSLVMVDEKIRRLYFDLYVPLMVAKEYPADDRQREVLLTVLNEAVNILDLRKPYSPQFYSSVDDAVSYLAEHLYQPRRSPAEEAVATCIGHTHIDVAWLWTLAQTREKAARSFATVLKLMEDYPEYIFISSQPQLYQFVKEDHPELYAKIKERVKEGRWEPEGAMWVEADCNLASGESLVRQLLFGTRFFEKEFGVKSKILWLPDVFGYSAALPQLLKKAGIDYFMTTKISWNEFNKMPYDTFIWRGIDGTEILTHFITTRDPDFNLNPHCTTYNGKLVPGAIIGGWRRYQQKNINHDILVAFGYGDGGGGPTPEMLENGRRMSRTLPGCPKVQMGRAADYFQRLAAEISGKKDLPRWSGELYLEYHRGTYTSMGRNKRYNRRSELLYQDTEFLSSWSRLLGHDYPQKEINQGWETILLNQFHDILPGSAIKEVYEDSRRQYEQILAQGRKLADTALAAISAAIKVENPSVIVFNTVSFDRDEIVNAEIPGGDDYSSVIDEAGRRSPIQRVADYGKNSVIFTAAKVPAKGYRVYRLSKEVGKTPSELRITPSGLENRYFRIEIDSRGTIASFYDKVNRRQVLKPGQRGNMLQAFEDKPAEFDNWNIDLFFLEKMWEIDEAQEITVIEEGPVRGGIVIRKKFLDSTIEQKIYIYQDIPRVDFDTEIDWRENQVLLKAAFPVDVHAEKATFDIQFGNVERPAHSNTSWDLAQFEVPAHKWVDLSEAGYGLSLLNDCKYGHDIKDGLMRLTLIKSGNDPNPEADREKHHFRYALYPHSGDWRTGGTNSMAYSFNVPLYSRFEEPHSGTLPSELSLFRVDRENVVLETVKKAEDSDAVILRFYESENRRSTAHLSSFLKILRVTECNLLEEEQEEIPVTDQGFQFEIKPYEIKTFKVEIR
ncbi:MAG: alpha-mannosidase [Bacillota bacterium]